jgi:glycosyltransferase involved in cell wall biosynthesis
MRVLYVIDSLIGGGAEHSLAHMAPGYAGHGLELHVAFLKSRWDVADALRQAGVVLHPTALDRSRPRQLVELVRLIRRLRPDIVHTTLWEADVLGRTAAVLGGTPVVTTFANSSYSTVQASDPSVRRTKLRAAQLIDLATARAAVRFHAVSQTVADDMAARMHVDRDRIVVVPRARRRDQLGEPTAGRRARARMVIGISPDDLVVLAIARQEHQKGLDVLVDAAALLRQRIPALRVLVAGRRGRASDDLEHQVGAARLGSIVEFLGARDDVADLIVAADVVAVPSRVEGMPGAVLEAMALERPVVASDIPMVREAIGDLAAALVPVGDAAGFAAALERTLMANNSELTAAARSRFDARFAPGPVVDRLAGFYRDAVAASRWARIHST